MKEKNLLNRYFNRLIAILLTSALLFTQSGYTESIIGTSTHLSLGEVFFKTQALEFPLTVDPLKPLKQGRFQKQRLYSSLGQVSNDVARKTSGLLPSVVRRAVSFFGVLASASVAMAHQFEAGMRNAVTGAIAPATGQAPNTLLGIPEQAARHHDNLWNMTKALFESLGQHATGKQIDQVIDQTVRLTNQAARHSADHHIGHITRNIIHASKEIVFPSQLPDGSSITSEIIQKITGWHPPVATPDFVLPQIHQVFVPMHTAWWGIFAHAQFDIALAGVAIVATAMIYLTMRYRFLISTYAHRGLDAIFSVLDPNSEQNPKSFMAATTPRSFIGPLTHTALLLPVVSPREYRSQGQSSNANFNRPFVLAPIARMLLTGFGFAIVAFGFGIGIGLSASLFVLSPMIALSISIVSLGAGTLLWQRYKAAQSPKISSSLLNHPRELSAPSEIKRYQAIPNKANDTRNSTSLNPKIAKLLFQLLIGMSVPAAVVGIGIGMFAAGAVLLVAYPLLSIPVFAVLGVGGFLSWKFLAGRNAQDSTQEPADNSIHSPAPTASQLAVPLPEPKPSYGPYLPQTPSSDLVSFDVAVRRAPSAEGFTLLDKWLALSALAGILILTAGEKLLNQSDVVTGAAFFVVGAAALFGSVLFAMLRRGSASAEASIPAPAAAPEPHTVQAATQNAALVTVNFATGRPSTPRLIIIHRLHTTRTGQRLLSEHGEKAWSRTIRSEVKAYRTSLRHRHLVNGDYRRPDARFPELGLATPTRRPVGIIGTHVPMINDGIDIHDKFYSTPEHVRRLMNTRGAPQIPPSVAHLKIEPPPPSSLVRIAEFLAVESGLLPVVDRPLDLIMPELLKVRAPSMSENTPSPKANPTPSVRSFKFGTALWMLAGAIMAIFLGLHDLSSLASGIQELARSLFNGVHASSISNVSVQPFLIVPIVIATIMLVVALILRRVKSTPANVNRQTAQPKEGSATPVEGASPAELLDLAALLRAAKALYAKAQNGEDFSNLMADLVRLENLFASIKTENLTDLSGDWWRHAAVRGHLEPVREFLRPRKFWQGSRKLEEVVVHKVTLGPKEVKKQFKRARDVVAEMNANPGSGSGNEEPSTLSSTPENTTAPTQFAVAPSPRDLRSLVHVAPSHIGSEFQPQHTKSLKESRSQLDAAENNIRIIRKRRTTLSLSHVEIPTDESDKPYNDIVDQKIAAFEVAIHMANPKFGRISKLFSRSKVESRVPKPDRSIPAAQTQIPSLEGSIPDLPIRYHVPLANGSSSTRAPAAAPREIPSSGANPSGTARLKANADNPEEKVPTEKHLDHPSSLSAEHLGSWHALDQDIISLLDEASMSYFSNRTRAPFILKVNFLKERRHAFEILGVKPDPENLALDFRLKKLTATKGVEVKKEMASLLNDVGSIQSVVPQVKLGIDQESIVRTVQMLVDRRSVLLEDIPKGQAPFDTVLESLRIEIEPYEGLYVRKPFLPIKDESAFSAGLITTAPHLPASQVIPANTPSNSDIPPMGPSLGIALSATIPAPNSPTSSLSEKPIQMATDEAEGKALEAEAAQLMLESQDPMAARARTNFIRNVGKLIKRSRSLGHVPTGGSLSNNLSSLEQKRAGQLLKEIPTLLADTRYARKQINQINDANFRQSYFDRYAQLEDRRRELNDGLPPEADRNMLELIDSSLGAMGTQVNIWKTKNEKPAPSSKIASAPWRLATQEPQTEYADVAVVVGAGILLIIGVVSQFFGHPSSTKNAEASLGFLGLQFLDGSIINPIVTNSPYWRAAAIRAQAFFNRKASLQTLNGPMGREERRAA